MVPKVKNTVSLTQEKILFGTELSGRQESGDRIVHF